MDVIGAGAVTGNEEALRAEVARLQRRVARERAARKQAEGLIEEKSRELWEQRERYRLLAENGSDVVIQLAPDYTITWASPSMQDILDWPASDLTGSPVAAYIHPDDLDLVLRARDHLIAGVGSVDEFRFRRADGEYSWMAGRSRRLRDHAAESALGWVVALRDVDELILARRELMSDRARLKATLDSLLDPHVLLVAVRDQAQVIVDFIYGTANDAACDYMQMTREDLEGARLLDLLPGQAGSGMLAMYADAVDSGEPLSLDDYAYPHEMLNDERRYDIRAVRVGDALSFTWRDVTDRFTAAQALAEQEREYRLLAENAGDIVVRTRHGIALWMSPSSADVLGYAPEALVGSDLTELIHPADLAKIAVARQGMEPGQTSRLRYRLRTRAGTYRWVQANTRIWVDDDGRQDGAVATIRDIDDEMTALQALEDSEERYRLLADNSSDVVMHVRDGLILWVSPALTDMLGWSPADWIGTLFDDVIHPDDVGRLLQARADIRAGATTVDRFRARARDGDYHWIETHARPYLDVNGAWDGAVVSFRTVDAEVRAEQELEHRAHYDELTGLVNRNELFDRFAPSSPTSAAPATTPPRSSSTSMSSRPSTTPTATPPATNSYEPWQRASRPASGPPTWSPRRRRRVRRHPRRRPRPRRGRVDSREDPRRRTRAHPRPSRVLNVTASIGVTTASPGGTVDDVIARADAAMYQAKSLGRDRVLPIP